MMRSKLLLAAVAALLSYAFPGGSSLLLAVDTQTTLQNGQAVRTGDPIKCGKLITITSDAPDGSVLWFVRTPDVDYEIVQSAIKMATPCRNVDIQIDVVEIDWEKRQVTGQRTKLLTIRCDDSPVPPVPPNPPNPPGPGPTPPDPPLPPDGPFDGIAAKVRATSNGMTAAERANCAAVLNEAADGMNFPVKFTRIEDVRGYIARNWPQTCTLCMKVYSLIQTDAPTRQYSWQEAQAYYREVAKGVQL